MQSIKKDTVMTVKEVATYLKISPSTVYRLAKAGRLPCRKVGGTWRFSRPTLENWIATQEQGLLTL